MKFCNIDTSVFNEPEFSAATNKQIGIWLRLYAYCADLENRGIIIAAGGWSDTHCRRVLGCSRKDLDRSPLWNLQPSGLLNLYHYNLIAEEFSKKRRKSARIGGQQRSQAKTEAARANGEKGGRPCKIINLPAS